MLPNAISFEKEWRNRCLDEVKRTPLFTRCKQGEWVVPLTYPLNHANSNRLTNGFSSLVIVWVYIMVVRSIRFQRCAGAVSNLDSLLKTNLKSILP